MAVMDAGLKAQVEAALARSPPPAVQDEYPNHGPWHLNKILVRSRLRLPRLRPGRRTD
jgi:hypothetical protein